MSTLGCFPNRLTSVGMLCVLGLLASGCGDPDRAQVTGKAARVDGTPVEGARVVFRSPTTGESANGLTNSEGEYALGVMTKGDGIPSGEYEVTVLEDLGTWENPKPPTIHPNYRHPKNSGLRATIVPGESLRYDLELKKPPNAR